MRVVALLALTAAVAVAALDVQSVRDQPAVEASAVYDGTSWSVKPGIVDGAIAVARYQDAVNKTGWAVLSVNASSAASVTNYQRAYGAGFVEGALTNASIYLAYLNNGGDMDIPPKLATFLKDQAAWVADQIKANPHDDYWQQVALVQAQLDGLYDGYVASVPKDHAASKEQLVYANMAGDLETYLPLFGGGSTGDVWGLDKCSALVKWVHTADTSDLFFSHVTWSSLNSMLRIYKLYDLPFVMTNGDVVPGRTVSFSGYPATVFSGDDFYQLSSGLAVLETTVGNGNNDLWKYCTTKTVLEYIRNIVANRLATDGASWSNVFARYNSGTYNNEFLIADYKLFNPALKELKPNTLWVLDQVPGHVKAGDVTDVLVKQGGYFPSYNIPYWPSIFNVSGGPAAVASGGEWFSYGDTARAKIFRRNQTGIVDLDTMAAVMRYNNFKHDPLSVCEKCTPKYTAENAVSCRDDLMPADGVYPISAFGHRNHAGTDAKIVSKALMDKHTTLAISGPTYEQQPVFSWSNTTWTNLAHYGHPDRFEFPWVLVSF